MAVRAFGNSIESISEDCSVGMDVARPFRSIQHGTPIEAQARKKAKKEVSVAPTQGVTDENANNSPSATDNETSSSSETASTVDDLDELKDNYTSLQSISAAMREAVPFDSRNDVRRPSLHKNGISKPVAAGLCRCLPHGHWPDLCFQSNIW